MMIDIAKQVNSIDVDYFEIYTGNGDLFSVEEAARHFNVSKLAIRTLASSLGYSHEKAMHEDLESS